MEHASQLPTLPPSHISGYTVVRALAGETFLANGAGGRAVVLKKLDDDCLLSGHLHPHIKQRLARVRELAHRGVANLHGVERDADTAWLVWEYIDGQTLDEFAADSAVTVRQLITVARELILAVEGLHALGIVHGSIHGHNVVVADGIVRITHISPLLYADPADDAAAVVALLHQLVERSGDRAAALSKLLAEKPDDRWTLRALAARLALVLDVRGGDPAPPVTSPEPTVRGRVLIAAGASAVIAIALGLTVLAVVRGMRPTTPVPPSVSPDMAQPGASASVDTGRGTP